MVPDGLRGDPEPLPDLGVRPAGGDQLEDLELALGELRERRPRTARRRRRTTSAASRSTRRRSPRRRPPPGSPGAARRRRRPSGCSRGRRPASPRTASRRPRTSSGSGRRPTGRRARIWRVASIPDISGIRRSISTIAGSLRRRQRDRLDAGLRLADEREVRRALDEPAQPVAVDRVIVGDEDADRRRATIEVAHPRREVDRAGGPRTRVPPDSALASIVTSPPTSAARSCIARVPTPRRPPSTPRPSSTTSTSSSSSPSASRTSQRWASAWRTTFRSASTAIR